MLHFFGSHFCHSLFPNLSEFGGWEQLLFRDQNPIQQSWFSATGQFQFFYREIISILVTSQSILVDVEGGSNRPLGCHATHIGRRLEERALQQKTKKYDKTI